MLLGSTVSRLRWKRCHSYHDLVAERNYLPRCTLTRIETLPCACLSTRGLGQTAPHHFNQYTMNFSTASCLWLILPRAWYHGDAQERLLEQQAGSDVSKLQTGMLVKVHSLKAAASQQHNEQEGILGTFDENKKRWIVILSNCCEISCQPENLELQAISLELQQTL